MPDIFDNLTPTSIPRMADEPNINKLPDVDFSQLPTYQAPNFQQNDIDFQAQNDFDNTFFKPVDTSKFDAPLFRTYDENLQKKFANSPDAFKKLGFNPYSDNEEWRYDEVQPKGEAAWNTFAKFVGYTTSTFAHAFTQNFDSIKSLTNMEISDAWKNNPNLKQLSQQQEMDTKYPTFTGPVQPKWYNFIPFTKGSADFYENFVPQLGFTAGTLLETVGENALIGFLTGGAGNVEMAPLTGRKIYNAISDLFSLEKGLKLVNDITKGTANVNTLRTGLQMWNMTNTAASEASVEAGTNYNETRKALIDDYKNKYGKLPNQAEMEEMDKLATTAGNQTYGVNIPVLMVSNWIQFKSLMMPEFARLRAFEESLGKFGVGLDEATNLAKLEIPTARGLADVWKASKNPLKRVVSTLGYFATSEGLQSATTEGLEETTQRIISSGTSAYARDKFQGKPNAMNALGYAVGDALSQEGLMEFTGGFLGGTLFHGAGAALKRVAGTPKETIDAQGNKTYKMNFLNKLGLYSDAFVQNQQMDRAQKVVDYLNVDVLDTIFKEEGLKDMFLQNKDAAAMRKYLKDNDIFNFTNLKSRLINRFLYSGYATGKIDLRMKQLDNWLSMMTDKDLTEQLGVETDENTRAAAVEYINHIKARQPQFEAIFNSESKRFDAAGKRLYAANLKAHDTLEQFKTQLKGKYNVEDLEDLITERDKFYSDQIEKWTASQTEIEQEAIVKETEDYAAANKEKLDDLDQLKHLTTDLVHKRVATYAFEEGKKMTVFAAADMLDSADRARKIIKNLADNSNGLRFTEVDKLLSIPGIEEELKRQEAYVKDYNLREFKDEQRMAQERIVYLNELLDMYKSGEYDSGDAADAMHDYLYVDPTVQKKQAFAEYDHVRDNKRARVKTLTQLVDLQKRHQDNLDLYRFMENADALDKITPIYSEKVEQFINKVAEEHIKQNIDPTPQAEQQEQTTPQETPGEATVVNPADARVAHFKDKIAKNEILTEDELKELAGLAGANAEAMKLYTDYVEAHKPAETPAAAEDVPEEFRNAAPIIVEGQVATPDEAHDVTTEEVERDKSIVEAHRTGDNPNRTIINQLAGNSHAERMSQLTKATPEIESYDSYPSFITRFLTYLAADNQLLNYQAFIVLDSADNYPEDNGAHKYLKANPSANGIVLQFRDSMGNSKFDDDFLPDEKGKHIVYSLTSGSNAKNELRDLMKLRNVSEIPVTVSKVSHGMFDVRQIPVVATELLADIDPRTYSLVVAQGNKGELMFERNGMLLRNGGLYIKAQQSYIKLLPFRISELNVNGAVGRDVTSLIGHTFTTQSGATAVAQFLGTIFYQSFESGKGEGYMDIRVAQVPKGGYKIVASVHENGKNIYDEGQIREYLKNKRLNVRDMNMRENPFTFFYMAENGQVEFHTFPNYESFLTQNAYTDKKAYLQDGKKVLTPINRYVQMETKLSDLVSSLKPQPVSQELTVEEQPAGDIIKPELDVTETNKALEEAKKRAEELKNKPKRAGDDLLRAKNVDDQPQILVNSREVQFIQERFGEDAVQRLTGIINSEAWGIWKTSGITLFADAPLGTGYHEAWHHFSQLYLTVPEKFALYDELRKTNLGLVNATDLEIEEHIAEDFRQYMLSDGQSKLTSRPDTRNIFQKLWDLIKSLFGRGPVSLNKLYNDLRTNNLSKYSPSVNNALWGKLNSRVLDNNGNEVFSNRKSGRYISYLSALFGQYMAARPYAGKIGTPFSLLQVTENNTAKGLIEEAHDELYIKIVQDFENVKRQEDEYFAKNGTNSVLAETLQDLTKLTVPENFEATYREFIKSTKTGPHGQDYEFETPAVDEPAPLEDTEITEEPDETNPELGGATTVEEAKDKDNAGKGYDRPGNDVSSIDLAPDEVKQLIRNLAKVEVDKETGLPVRDEQGNVKMARNVYGLPEPVNFFQIYNNMANLLEGSFSYQEMLNKLANPENQKKFPEAALLLERLPKMSDESNFFSQQLITRFTKAFQLTYIPIYSLVMKKETNGKRNAFFKEETRRTGDLIKREWSSNFQAFNEETYPFIMMDDNKRPFINPEHRFRQGFRSKEDAISFLASLGIRFSPVTTQTRDFEKLVSNDNYKDLLLLQDAVNKRLEAGQVINDPVKALEREYRYNSPSGGFTKIDSERRILNALLDVEVKYSSLNPSMSFRNAEGQMQYGLSMNNWLTNSVYWLSRSSNYSQIANSEIAQHLNVKNNPHLIGSIFLNQMFEYNPKTGTYGRRRSVNGEPVTIELGNYNGIKDADDNTGETKGQSTTSLTPRDKMRMDINALFAAGASEIMRTESSATAFFVGLSNYSSQDGRVKRMPISLIEMNNTFNNTKIDEIFTGYFEAELAVVANLYNSDLEGYYPSAAQQKAYDETGKALTNPGRFSLFREILGRGLSKDIETELKSAVADFTSSEEKHEVVNKFVAKYKERMLEGVRGYFDTALKQMTRKLKEYNITESDIGDNLKTQTIDRKEYNFGLDELARAFLVNDMILNIEFSKLFSGNTAYYKAYHKRSKGDTSTKIRPLVDSTMVGFLESTHANTMAGAMGVNFNQDLNKTKTLVLKDDKRESVYFDEYIETVKKLRPQDDPATAARYEKNISRILKSYKDLNVADGQGHCTLDFYRQFRMQVGNWDYKDEVQYRKEVILFKQHNDLYEKTEEGKAAREQDNVNLERWKDVQSYFNPIKMQHNGPLVVKGTFAPVLDKFSIAPLLPSVIRDTKWESVNLDLIKNGVGYTKFESGTKKYAHPATNFYSGDWSVEPDVAGKVHQVFTANLGEQIITKSAVKSESIWGTQMRKLFMANVFSLGRTNSRRMFEILQEYKGIMRDMINYERAKLYNEFGIVEDKQGNLTIRDAKDFVETLQKQVEARNMNSNIRDAIQHDKDTKQLVYPLEILNNKAAVQDLIAGLIDKRLSKIKLNGDMLIQVASSGFESKDFKYTNASKADQLKYGTNGLSFYRMTYDKDGKPLRTSAMQIKVGLNKDFLSLLESVDYRTGQKVGTIEKLNELLKDKKWMDDNRQKVTMIGYRIPTQGVNSMEFMEIAEFLPSQAGSIVILPAEIVAKAGSDYDIDKLSIFRPSLDSKGELVSASTLGKIDNELAKIKAELGDIHVARHTNPATLARVNKLMNDIFNKSEEDEDLDAQLEALRAEMTNEFYDLVKRYKFIAKSRKEALTNQMIKIYHDVLSSPEMFLQLITPNNVGLVKGPAEAMADKLKIQLGDYTDTDVYGYVQNLNKFEQLLSGKRDLGRFALGNTMSQLLQQAGMTLNPIYNIWNNKKQVFDQQTTTLWLFTPKEREQLKVGNRIDYSSARNTDDIYKQEFFSQLINSTVDIATDPYYMGMGINNTTIGVAIHLLLMGLPFKRVLNFINQPIIRHYHSRKVRIPDPRNKPNNIKSILGAGGLNTADINNYVENRDRDIEEQDNLTDENLAAQIDKYGNYYSGYLETPEDTVFQRKVFAHFLKLQAQSDILRNLQFTSTFDTTKFLGPVSMQQNLDLRIDLEKADLFEPAAVLKMRNDSLISAFNNIESNIKLFSTLMPVGMSPVIVDRSAKILNRYAGDKFAKGKLERVVSNDWMEFIIKNFSVNPNIEVDGRLKTIQYTDNVTLADKIASLKSALPALSSYSLVKRLFSNISQKQPTVKNVELYRGMDNSTELQDVLIEEWRQLRDFTGQELFGASFTADDVRRIREVFGELPTQGFFQSGFNRSPISFNDVIPYEEIMPKYKEALNNYLLYINTVPGAEDLLANIFTDLFYANNPKFAPDNLNDIAVYRVLTPVNEAWENQEPWRGKHYLVSTAYGAREALEQLQKGKNITEDTLATNAEDALAQKIIPVEPKALPAPVAKVTEGELRYKNAKDLLGKVITVGEQKFRVLEVRDSSDFEDMKELVVQSKSGLTTVLTIAENGEIEALSVNDIYTATDTSISKLGITQQEWDALSKEEQDNIKKCN